MQKSVLEYLENSVIKYQDKVAFFDKDNKLTYKEVYNNSKSVASYIIKNNNIFNEPIAILLPKNIYSLVAFFGVTYSGNIYVPIDIKQPIDRIKNIFSTLKPKIVIVNSETENILKELDYNENVIDINNILNTKIDDIIINKIRKKQISTNPLYILFTSGSTGTPKGVVINHQSVIDYIDWVQDTFFFDDSDIFANQAPFFFDNSVLDIYTTLKVGCSMYIVPEMLFTFKNKLLQELEDKKVTSIFWVPSVLIGIANSNLLEKYNYKGLKKILFCGEVMPNKQLNIWRKYLPNPIYANLYGPTEITDACIYYIVDREFNDDEPLPIGYPCNNTDIILLKNDNTLVSNQEIGEICVKGISLSIGYYNNKEKTDEVFIQNPINNSYREIIYKTGDLAYYNDRKEIIYVGRKDFQIKHNGYRIEIGEIETAVSSIQEINNQCVLYDDLNKEITLFYTANSELPIKYLREKLLLKLAKYAIPTKIYFMDEMPLTLNGKIDRQYLKKKYIGE